MPRGIGLTWAEGTHGGASRSRDLTFVNVQCALPRHVKRMDKNETDEPRRRVSAEGVRVSREALHLVRPINEKLGGWQAESIRLETTARRMKESGRHDPGVIESIRTLLGYVEEQR